MRSGSPLSLHTQNVFFFQLASQDNDDDNDDDEARIDILSTSFSDCFIQCIYSEISMCSEDVVVKLCTFGFIPQTYLQT